MGTHNRGGKALLVILLGGGVLSLAVGAGIGIVLGRRAHGRSHGPGHRARAEAGDDGQPQVQTIQSLGELVVNLADTSTLRYAKASVALGIQEKVPEEKLKEYLPVFKDAVIGVLTSKRFDQLHRKNGIPMLKEAILKATADRLPDAHVARVYLEAFAMQ